MNTITKTISAIILIFSLASCQKETLRGSGSITTDIRSLTPFNEVSIHGVHEAEIIHSNENKVEIAGYALLSAVVKTEVSGNRLSIKYPKNTRVQNDNLKFKVYTSDLKILRQDGNTKVKVNAGFNPESLRLIVNGSSQCEIAENNTSSFRVEATGSSKVMARNLIAKSAVVTASGSTEVELTTTEYLNAKATGSSKVWYWGAVANTDISTSGSARVSRL